MAKMVASALLHSRLDYTNSILFCIVETLLYYRKHKTFLQVL